MPSEPSQRRPVLVTALRPAWRGRSSMQFGVDPVRAVVVDGVDEPAARWLLGLDGLRTESEILREAAAARLDVTAVASLLHDLRRSGLVVDATPFPSASVGPGGTGLSPAVTSRLAPDLASLILLAADRLAAAGGNHAGRGGGSADAHAAGAVSRGGSVGLPAGGPTYAPAGRYEPDDGPSHAPVRPDDPDGEPSHAAAGHEDPDGAASGLPRSGDRAAADASGKVDDSATRPGPPTHQDDPAGDSRCAWPAGERSARPPPANRGGPGGGGLGAEEVLRRRRAAAVLVHGAGRVGGTLSALLAAAGVGHVHVVDRGAVRPEDLAPGGIGATDVYQSRAAAAADAVRRCAPEVRTGPVPADRRPDLVVIASTRPVDTDLSTALHAARLPHLIAGVRETTAIVGPLVVPGQTSCLRCADLHRADRDPAWPALAAQLAGSRRPRAAPRGGALRSVAAALGALHCPAPLAGDESVPTRGGALELALPDWRLRRRGWPPHRRCGCGGWAAPGGPPTGRGEWSP